MLTYERYQALRAINIRVPGEPGNEAINAAQSVFTYGLEIYMADSLVRAISK